MSTDELQQLDIDGVPVFSADSGHNPLTACLRFRIGVSDATLLTHGWVHLIEHLCLHDRDVGGLLVNGQVSPLYTDFYFRGMPTEVGAALSGVCSWLREPALDRLSKETGVLWAEGDERLASAATALSAFVNRFGATGTGLVGMPEFGLRRVDESQLRAFLPLGFNSNNAVLMLDGPIPPGLSLGLPSGAPRPFPAVPKVEDEWRLRYQCQHGIAVSGMMARGWPSSMANFSLERALYRTWRTDEGTAYSPSTVYEAVSPQSAISVGLVRVAADYAVEPGIMRMLDEWDAGSDLDDDLGRFLSLQRQALTGPGSHVALVSYAGFDHFEGHKPAASRAEVINEIEHVSRDEVVERIHQFRGSLFLGIPDHQALADTTLPVLGRPTVPVPEGTTYRSSNAPLDKSCLTLGSSTLVASNGETSTGVNLDDVVAMVAYSNGRTLIVDNGWDLTVTNRAWRRGSEVSDALDARFSDVRVDMPGELSENVLPRWRVYWGLLGEAIGSMSQFSIWLVVTIIATLAAGLIQAVTGVSVIKYVFIGAVSGGAAMIGTSLRPERRGEDT